MTTTTERFGIDLGTTNSVLAIYKSGLKFFKNRQGQQLTPSWATYKDGGWTVGEPSKSLAVLFPLNTIYAAKRLMGRNFSDEKVKEASRHLPYKVKPAGEDGSGVLIEIDGQDFQPQDVAAQVLRKMKEDAEYLTPGTKVDKVVVTVPAYFNESQNAATMEAGRRAGLNVLALLPEPAAAAYAFATDPSKHDGRLLLVYDLGGGTFDVTIIMVAEGHYIPNGLAGDMWLGGEDFDRAIMDALVEHIKRVHGQDPTDNPMAMMEIKKWAEDTKENLSDMEVAEIDRLLPAPFNLRVQFSMARAPRCPDCQTLCQVSAERTDDSGWDVRAVCPSCNTQLRGKDVEDTFEGRIAPLVRRTIELTDYALSKAGFKAEEMVEVLMVGGSTFIPAVQEAVRRRFGADKVRFDMDPMKCVAQGAAIYSLRVPEKWQCPKCKRFNDLSVGVCADCQYQSGHEEQEDKKPRMVECPNCHRQVPLETERCECGLPLGGADAVGGGITAQAYGVGLEGNRYGVVLKEGTPWPTSEGVPRTFYTVYDNQKMVNVPVYCGDFVDDVTKNDRMGHVLVTLGEPVPKGTPVVVTFSLDRSQLLEVTVEVQGQGGKQHKAKVHFQHPDQSSAGASALLDKLHALKAKAGEEIGAEDAKSLEDLENAVVNLSANNKMNNERRMDELRDLESRFASLAGRIGGGELPPPEAPWLREAKGSISLAKLALEKIKPLMEVDDEADLRRLAGALEQAVSREDEVKGKALTEEIDSLLQNRLDTIAAKTFNAYLMTFRVQGINPAKGTEYRARLDHLVPRLGGGSFEAEEELNRLIAEMHTVLRQAPLPQPPNGRPAQGPGTDITDRDQATGGGGKGNIFLSD